MDENIYGQTPNSAENPPPIPYRDMDAPLAAATDEVNSDKAQENAMRAEFAPEQDGENVTAQKHEDILSGVQSGNMSQGGNTESVYPNSGGAAPFTGNTLNPAPLPQHPAGSVPPYAPPPYGTMPPSPPRPKKRYKGLTVLAVLLAITIALTGLFLAIDWLTKDTPPTRDDTQMTIHETPLQVVPPAEAGQILTGTQIVEKLQPSVVGIVLFSSRSSNSVGSATGIIMGEDKEGKHTYVITAAHVIDIPGNSVKVQFEDGTQVDAEIVGYDKRTDLGVLRIKKTGLAAAEFGNSDVVRRGETIWVMGNPAGMDFFGSVTTGVVSNVGREMRSENEMSLIQIDAAVNPGNSGGPLINNYGQVIGIISLKLVSSEIEGMGFVVPSTPAKEIINKIIAHGMVPDRARLGIEYMEASQSSEYSRVLQMMDLPAGSLIIRGIDPASELINTEAQVNDLIVAVNGKKLDKPDLLLEIIQSGKPGDELKLDLVRVYRDFTKEEFTVRAKLIPDSAGSPSENEPQTKEILPPF
ncbi:MAG: S1C family serine protease [Oscillospiraceae bacterium]|nr:S1C family serine protease [Oscillospiraceae bacterium]